MERSLFWVATALAIVALNWLRISFLGELPPGSNPITAWIATLVAIIIDVGLFSSVYSLRRKRLIGEGCPDDQLDFRGQMRFVAEQRTANRIAQAERIKALAAAQDAELIDARTGTLKSIQPARAIIRKGEIAYGQIPAALCEIKTVGYSGRSAGVSFRVAKGVTLRTGGFKAAPKKELVTAAVGDLIITNKRIIFAGDKKSLSISLDNLVAVDRANGGFNFSESNKTHFVRVDENHGSRIFEIILERMIAEN